ncbi:ketoacyl-synthetase C-terminal extension domain-containing protein, partial [Streptomyces sp. NK08204]|uniref:CurL C-terminal domain-containing protein n=1 Tax=Streptomyces sp. NK08204 TaxID=2873260 RepID=UPI0027E23FE1
GAVELLTEAAPWPTTGRPRRAGVSSFGISGTNAHVVLEQADPTGESVDVDAGGADRPALPWLLSAKSDAALRAQAERLLSYLTDRPELSTADVAWSLATGRASFEHRAVVVAGDREGFREGLAALAEGRAVPGAVSGVAGGADQVVLVFPGQGSQWVGMAAELLDA